MATRDPSCPICDADVPMSGDERPGEEVYCSFCRAPLIVGGSPEADQTELEEDW